MKIIRYLSTLVAVCFAFLTSVRRIDADDELPELYAGLTIFTVTALIAAGLKLREWNSVHDRAKRLILLTCVIAVVVYVVWLRLYRLKVYYH
ncbi:MAG TPA: hypothetical protein VGK19_00010 [Capsulimonadaceae bacterium]|jgi:uncharacterized membrane protein YadS